MSTVATALDNVYASLANDNADIDTHIASLKSALTAEGKTSVEVDSSKLAQPNRQGRKYMQSYFKQRGVVVTFTDKA